MAAVLAACGGSSHTSTSGSAGNAGVQPAGAGANSTAPPAAVVAKAKQSAGRLSSGVVATVAGQPITLAQYQAAYNAQFRSLNSGSVPLDPPSFSRCVAGMVHIYAQLKPVKGTHVATPSHAKLLDQCRARFAGVKQGVMTQLIQQRWMADEAKLDGVNVSDAQVNAMIARQEKAFGGAAAYDRYLAKSGQTRDRVANTMRLLLTEQALQQRRLGQAVAISDQQVAAYFNAHKAEFALPRQSAPKLSTYQARIRALLQEQARARRSAGATTSYERRWRSHTICAPGYVVPLCANAPA